MQADRGHSESAVCVTINANGCADPQFPKVKAEANFSQEDTSEIAGIYIPGLDIDQKSSGVISIISI